MILFTIGVNKLASKNSEYCKIQMKLFKENEKKYQDEIELLHVILDKWENDNYTKHRPSDPIVLIKILLEDHGIKAKDLAEILGLTKGTVSKILNYQKGLSKNSIRILAERFKIQQDFLNQPYPLVKPESGKLVQHSPVKQKKAP